METEYFNAPHRKKFRLKKHIMLITFLIFLGILSFLIYTSFYDVSFFDNGITGNLIMGDSSEQEGKSVQIDGDLTEIPSLKLKGNFENVEITGSSGSYIYIDSQKFYLGNSLNNYIVLENYSGEISFDDSEISSLSGGITRAVINGVEITPAKTSMKVKLENPIDYNSLKIENQVLVKKLFYATSGVLKINGEKNIINLYNENISIGNFAGNIEIEKDRLKIQGTAKSLNVEGDSKINING